MSKTDLLPVIPPKNHTFDLLKSFKISDTEKNIQPRSEPSSTKNGDSRQKNELMRPDHDYKFLEDEFKIHFCDISTHNTP